MSYLDISLPVHPDMLLWPGDPWVEIHPVLEVLAGVPITVSELRLGSHTGTHVDARRHLGLSEEGVDQLPLEALIGPCRVHDLRDRTEIGEEALWDAQPPRVLLRTRNSEWVRTGPIPARPAHLTRSGAHCLVERGVSLVGIDGLSVDAQDHTIAHEVLLAAGVVILEGVDLSRVEPGAYELICLPLRIAGADGAPARAVLRREVYTLESRGRTRGGE